MKYLFSLVALLISSFFSYPVQGNQASNIERQIKNHVLAQQASQLLLLEKLVNINSGTENSKGVYQVGKLLQSQFEQLGMKTRWVKQPPSMHHAGTFIAQKKGSQGKSILLIGHLDTVFSPTSSFQHFKRQGNKAIGPGVVDDKGGDVVILYALKTLQALHALDDVNITVVLTGDEEESSKPTSISRKPLIDAARDSDVALDFENAVTIHTASIARRGVALWRLETQGKENHSSEIFEKSVGYGAIFELTRILDEIQKRFSHEKYFSFNPGIILGGTTVNYDKKKSQGTAFGKSNVIAKTALATGDYRFLTLAQKLKAENKLAKIVNHPLARTKATFTFQDGIPAMSPTKNNLNLLNQYSKASIDLGYGAIKPLAPGLRGAGDISHVANRVPANLVGLGPAGSGLHTTKETLDLESLPIQTMRAALLIYRLSHEK